MENSFKIFLEKIAENNIENTSNQLNQNNQNSFANSIVLQENSITEIISILPIEMQKNDSIVQNKLKELSEIANSEPFVLEISQEIGLPTENESKSEFVERGLKIIREKLMKHLNDK